MKKQLYWLSGGLFLLILLTVAAFFLASQPKSQETPLQSKNSTEQLSKIFDKKMDEISKVIVKNSSGEFVVFVKNEQNKPIYYMENLSNKMQVSQSIVEAFLLDLTNLMPEKVVEENCEDFGKYGFNEPTATIKVVFTDGTERMVALGAQAPLGLGSYLRVDGESAVYLLAEVSTEIFINVKESYLESKG